MISIISTFLSHVSLIFKEELTEKEYMEFRRQDLKRNVRTFLKVISFGVFILILVVRDLNSLLFCTAAISLYYLNEYYDSFSGYVDIVLNIVAGFCYSMDHYTLDPTAYQTHVRCYIYVAVLFSLSITTSKNWLTSSLSFAVSNIIVSFNVCRYFKSVPSEYFIVVCTCITCFLVSLYCVESYSRKLYLMYKNMMELKKKQSTILNLFPECLVIANLEKQKFYYYNQAFDQLFNISTPIPLEQIDTTIRNQKNPIISSHYSIKATFVGKTQKRESKVLQDAQLWDILSFIRSMSNLPSLHIRILNKVSSSEDDKKLYYDVQSRTVDDKKNNYMFVFKNITTVKELEKNKTTQKMNKMAYYQVTHELLTPINSILSMVQILKQKIDGNLSEANEFLDVCYYTTHKMLRTIVQYTDMQKLDEGLIIPNVKKFDVIDWIEKLTSFYKFEATKKNLIYELDLSSLKRLNLTLRNDQNRLSQILQIIIDNALKYTNQGSIQIKVSEVEDMNSNNPFCFNPRTKVKIDVKDTGCGIDEEQQTKLFRIFEHMKFKQQINEGGAGIGLTFCKKMGNILKAQVLFDSIKGIGTTFTIIVQDLEMVLDSPRLARGMSFAARKATESEQQYLQNMKINSKESASFPNDVEEAAAEEEKESDDIDDYLGTDDDSEGIQQIDKYVLKESTQIFIGDHLFHSNPLINARSCRQDLPPLDQMMSGSMLAFNPNSSIWGTSRSLQKPDPNILIVDDDTFSVFSLQCLLKDIFKLDSDYRYSGNEAIRAVQNRIAQGKDQYKLIFMDLNMPELNGLETTNIIRKLNKDGARIQDPKIILYSCLSNTMDLPNLRTQFDDVANKPTDIGNLREILKKFALIQKSS